MTKQLVVEKRLPAYFTSMPYDTKIVIKTNRIKNVAIAEKVLFILLEKYRLQRGEFFDCNISIIEETFKHIENIFGLENEPNDIIIDADQDPEVAVLSELEKELANKSAVIIKTELDNSLKNIEQYNISVTNISLVDGPFLDESILKSFLITGYENDSTAKKDFEEELLKFKKMCDNNTFGIEITNVMKLLNITNRDMFKKRIKKFFVEGVDYITKTNQKREANTSRVLYYVTFKTFQKLCIDSRKIKNEAKDYYVNID